MTSQSNVEGGWLETDVFLLVPALGSILERHRYSVWRNLGPHVGSVLANFGFTHILAQLSAPAGQRRLSSGCV